MAGVSDLSLRDLSKAFPGQGEVLRNVSLSVPSGERFALLGASGSGKTTLLRLVAGLERPDAGDILLGGTSLLSLPAEKREVGLVFQNPLLFPHLSVAANLAFGPQVRGVQKREIAGEVTEMLSRVGLSGYGDRLPRQLSGGQEQRVALARALMTRPRLLLLDEPFSALDAPLRRELRAWVVALQRESGTTTVLVTHDQEEALAVAQRIGFFSGGRLVQVGSPENFYERPATLEVARFFGGVNFVEGEQRGAVLETPLGRFEVKNIHHGPVTLTFRPEALRVGGDTNAFDAVVERAEFAGTFRRYILRSGSELLEWHALPSLVHAPGDQVYLSVPKEACWTVERERTL